MKKASKLVASILMVCLALSFAACGGGTAAPASTTPAVSGAASTPASTPAQPGEKRSINMINTKDDIAGAMELMVAAFNEKHPDIEVVVETLSSNSDEVIQSRDAAGDLPDIMPVFNVGAPALGAWINSGKIQDVSGLSAFKALPDDIKNMISTPEGEAYCVILSTTAYTVTYNKELFKAAGIEKTPTTLDEMTEVCKKLQDAGITPFISGAKDGWTVSNQIWRAGLDAFFPKEWVDDMHAGNASFKDYGYGIFDFLDLFIANTQERPLDTDYMTQLALFAEGEGAMLVQGPWGYNNVVEMAPEMADICGAFAIPFHNDAAKNKLFVMQEMAYMVSAEADLEAVDAFFSFMVEDEKGREIFGKELNVMNPFGIENTQDPILSDIAKYVDSGNYVFNAIDNNRSSEFFMVDWTNMQDYMGGKLTQDQVLENMDTAWADMAAKAA